MQFVITAYDGEEYKTKIKHDYGFLRISKKQVLLQEV